MIMLLIAGLLANPSTQERHVKIGGSTYRVTWKGNRVAVAKKSLIVFKSLDQRDRMREAVQAATGCKLVDEMPVNASILEGKLACPL